MEVTTGLQPSLELETGAGDRCEQAPPTARLMHRAAIPQCRQPIIQPPKIRFVMFHLHIPALHMRVMPAVSLLNGSPRPFVVNAVKTPETARLLLLP